MFFDIMLTIYFLMLGSVWESILNYHDTKSWIPAKMSSFCHYRHGVSSLWKDSEEHDQMVETIKMFWI